LLSRSNEHPDLFTVFLLEKVNLLHGPRVSPFYFVFTRYVAPHEKV